MKLFDAITPEALRRLASVVVNVGDVYEINMNESNGIKPKPGDTSRNKYFIVLGVDTDGTVYGGVVINSKSNPNLPPHFRAFHMPIKPSKYPFLAHNSFVDCLRLKFVPSHKFTEWRLLGRIGPFDVSLIIEALKESPAESKANLALFGL